MMKRAIAAVVVAALALVAVPSGSQARDWDDVDFIVSVIDSTFDDVSYDTAESVCRSWFGLNGSQFKKQARKRYVRFWVRKGYSKSDARYALNSAFRENCEYYL